MKKLSLVVACILITTAINAQFTKLHEFNDTTITGKNPQGSFISDGTFLYGMTTYGGVSNGGTIFKIKSDGQEYSSLLDLRDSITGINPHGSLFYDGTFLYGMTFSGGVYSFGTLFKIKPNGTEFTKLLDFDSITTGSSPYGSLISDGTFLYGMTTAGGATNDGIIFKIKYDGTAFTKLFDFDVSTSGSRPHGSLYSDSTFLYGMTYSGGSRTNGTIFKLKPDGTEFTKLLDLENTLTGGSAYGDLISDGTFLYGMTVNGGPDNEGCIIKIKKDGTAFTRLLEFDNIATGNFPGGSFIFDGTYLYGMTSSGGPKFHGTVFKIKTDGTEFNNFVNFNGTMGGTPLGSLISDGTFLYGMTLYGGVNQFGTVFKVKSDGSQFSNLSDFEDKTAGAGPSSSLIADSTFLYGVTQHGGSLNAGTLFKMKSDGTEFTKMLDFNDITGTIPSGSLISDGSFMYGMTDSSGTNSYGTIFKIQQDGMGFTKLLDFDNTITGAFPTGSLITDGSNLYGMTLSGGVYSYGTIFKINSDGTGFTKLLDFDNTTTGGNPHASLIFDGTFLYGMNGNGGVNNAGTIFKIKPDGTSFTKLLDFDGTVTGTHPYGSLISDSTFLYGMTLSGGTNGGGTIFKLKPDGTTYTKLLDFDCGLTGSGCTPYGSLVLDGTNLFGTTSSGGADNTGTMFKVNKDGTEFTRLLNFDDTTTGSYPLGSLISDGSFLYGTAPKGGTYNYGTIFKMTETIPTCVANYITTYDGLLNIFIAVDSSTKANATAYKWDFGDGTTSTSVIPTHTYPVAGSYNVCMNVYRLYGDSCSYCQILTGDANFTINDTLPPPPCTAHYTTAYDSISNTFTITVDSATTAIATSYNWDFGDRSSSALATPSHVYTVDSLYNVCMKVFYADGDSCTYCHTIGIDSAGNIIRDGGFTLNVHNATTGISENMNTEIAATIFPNPSTGVFQLTIDNRQLNSNANLSIYNLVGERIYVKDGKQLNNSTTIDLSDQPNGIYFMQLKTEKNTITKKIIINK